MHEIRQLLPLLVSRRLLALVSGAMLLLLASWLLNIGSQKLLSQAQDAGRLIDIYQQLKGDIEQHKKDVKTIKKVALKLDKPAAITTSAVMTKVRSLAKQRSLSVREISTDVRQEQDGSRLMVSLETQGSYIRLKSLLGDLQQSYVKLRFESLRIEKTRRGQLVMWLKFSPGQAGS